MINYTKHALKALRAMQKSRATAIIAKIDDYAAGRQVDAKQLKGSDLIRIRVGQWRVIIDENDTVIIVLKIGTRGDVYKKGQ
jgi:mRNA interferase RelE/StbE